MSLLICFSVGVGLLGITIFVLLMLSFLVSTQFFIGSLSIPPEVTTLSEFVQFLSHEGTAIDILWEENGIELLLETHRHRPKLFKELIKELTPRRCLIKILNSSVTPLSPRLGALALELAESIGVNNLEKNLLEKIFCLCPLTETLCVSIVKRVPALARHTPNGGYPALPSLSEKLGNQPLQGLDGMGGIGGR